MDLTDNQIEILMQAILLMLSDLNRFPQFHCEKIIDYQDLYTTLWQELMDRG